MKVYLDTSVISALFDARNPERKALTETFFRESADSELFTSTVTLLEIEETSNPTLRERMWSRALQMSILPVSETTKWLASEYLRYGAIPEGHPEDAYHIAVAVENEMDCLLSWNFRHLVRRKTKDIIRMANSLNQFRQIEIMTPGEML